METALDKMESRSTLLNKVPEITIVFWIIKIMSTTVGETGADYLAVHVGLGATVTAAIMVAFLIAALIRQVRAPRYVPWIYWLTVVLVSVVGTQITDFLTDKLEISLYVSTAIFAVLLALTFAVWYAVERTLSIHTIVTTRRELFYWAAILFTFALGTAAGDLATEALSLGFNVGVLAFGALIGVIAAAYYLGANEVLTFWLAYILTRPLGASLGDLLSQSREYGGVGFGTTYTSLAFLSVIVALVAARELPAAIGAGETARRSRGRVSAAASVSEERPSSPTHARDQHYEHDRTDRDENGHPPPRACPPCAGAIAPAPRRRSHRSPKRRRLRSWAISHPFAPSSSIPRRWWTKGTSRAARPASRISKWRGTMRKRVSSRARRRTGMWSTRPSTRRFQRTSRRQARRRRVQAIACRTPRRDGSDVREGLREGYANPCARFWPKMTG